MPDLFFFVELAIESVFLTAFSFLFIIQLQQIQKKAINTRFFLVAMLMGSVAFGILLLDTILWEIDPSEENRIAFILLVIIFLQLFAIFWYGHYESMVNVVLPKMQVLAPLTLVILNLGILGLHLLESDFESVTLAMQIAFLTWIPICSVIIAIIMRNDLIELKRIPMIEVVAIGIQLGSAAVLLAEGLLYALGLYDKDISSLLTLLGLLIFFVGLLILLINYLFLNPPHVQLPSLQHEYFTKMRAAFADQKGKIGAQIDDFISTSVTELVPKKLPSTAIFILIQILNSEDFTSYAKSIEENINLSKSTVSYNLALLEKEGLIERKTISLQDDQRVKAVTICEKGFDYLFSFYLQLEGHFKPTRPLGIHFMKEYVEGLVDDALNVVLDGFTTSPKTRIEGLSAERLSEEALSLKPTKVLSPKEIFYLPHQFQATALAIVTLQEGTLEEIAAESGLDQDRTQKHLARLREMGFVGVKMSAGRPTYYCSH
ncbi:MAG: hypothetical protein ACFFGZ_02830 [Candidatus Thorarchaeota archaeon]